ncbi:MAG TPA: hypothetical protein VH476_08090 [Solirubrobacterales bacterium]
MDPTTPLASRGARRRARGFGISLAIALVATLWTATPVRAIGIPNSKCEPGADGFAIISSPGEWAQSFPATRSGKLLTVELKGISRQPGSGGADIEVRLYGADESGTPVDPVLDTTTIPGATITDDAHAYDYSANFATATATYLSAGRTYAIAAVTADDVQNAWDFHDGDPCANVELFSRYLSPFEDNAGDDAGLVTYVGPANDDFEHAQELVGREVAEEGTTAGATRQEPEEPDHYETNPPDSELWKGDHSVWYRWKAPNTGPTTIDTCIGEIDSILAVYTGHELGSLTRVADNNNDLACAGDDVYGSKVSFEAVGGTTYDIAVGDAGGAREKPFAIRIVGSPDITPPETQIDSGPSGPTTDASPSFAFSSSEPGSSFECRLDSNQDSAFAPCTSPQGYASLAFGAHTFEVRAIDEAENVDPTPASRSFTIEPPPPGQAGSSAAPPDTRIRKARISQAKNRATFRFSSTEPGSTFFCRIDRRPAKPCRSPKSYGHLKPGRHTFSVVAVDAGGSTDPTPAVRKFKIAP